jgi:hypothetical protein
MATEGTAGTGGGPDSTDQTPWVEPFLCKPQKSLNKTGTV